MKISVAHYKKSGSEFFINGGKLIFDDKEYILKSFFREIVRFSASTVRITEIEGTVFYRGFEFCDENNLYQLYFFPWTRKKLFKIINKKVFL